MPARLEQLERVEIVSAAQLRNWLLANHQQSESVWLVYFKKADPERHVPVSEIVDEALCFGWIDSLPRKLDSERTMILLSPRKRGSGWSAINKAKVAKLIATARIHAHGLAVVARAKADGSWDLLNDVEALVEPDDLIAALAAIPAARNEWDDLPPSLRRGLLEQIVQAKKPATRAARIAKIVANTSN